MSAGNDPNAGDDFAEMLQTAAQDRKVTAAKVGWEQARWASYALIGAAFLSVATALFAPGLPIWLPGGFWIAAFVLYLVTAGIFFGLFYWAQRNPLAPAVVGLVLFLAESALSMVVLQEWILHLVVLIALCENLRAALRHRRIMRQAMSSDPADSAEKSSSTLPS